MKRLHLLIFALLCISANAFAQFRLADNIADAEFVCASELEWTITNNYTIEGTDPTPGCGDAKNQSAWFKVQGMTPGTVELNFLNITAGQDYAVTVYASDGNESAPALTDIGTCAIVNNASTQVTFNYTGAEASSIFYVMVDGESDAEGSFVLSATGNAIASPGLVLTPSRVVGCWGDETSNLVRIRNNSVDNGGNDEFTLEITFVGADVEGIDQTGWLPPTVVSINGTPVNENIGVNGSGVYDNYPRGAEIELASGYPGTWEATLRPRNHECFDADFSSTSTSSTVQRLVVRRTDENFNPLDDPLFCEQNDLDTWYGKAELLPSIGSNVNSASIQSWSWVFKDQGGGTIGTVTDADAAFTANDGAKSTVTVDFPIPDANKNNFFIEIEVQGTCGPAERDYNMQAYVPANPVITPVAATCIADISASNPITFEVTNTDVFSPKPIKQPIAWDFGTLAGAAVISGDNGEIVTISDNTLFTPGTYPIEATITDEGDCFTTTTFNLDIAAKANIATIDTIPVNPNRQCNQFVFNQGDVVNFEFEVTDVLPAQGASVIVTYNGLEVLNTTQTAAIQTHSFQVTHTGDEADQILITVDNLAFPSVGICPTLQTIGLVLEKEEPILAIDGNSTVCISDVNAGTPLRVTIANADNILGGAGLISTTWSIDDADAVLASENATEINYASLPVGTHIITADVSYNGGICFEQITIPVTVVTQEEISVSAPNPIDPSVLNIQCNEVVYNAGDRVSFDATISNLVDPVVITVKRGNAILNTFSPQPADYTADSTYTVSFEVTHNGDDIDVITIEVANQTFPSVCTATSNIQMRLFQDGGPTIAPINPIFCVNKITNANPVSFSVSSPTSLPDVDNIVWSVLDGQGNPVNNIFTLQNGNDVSMTGFEVGNFVVQAEVNYVSGCTQTVNTGLTVLEQPEFTLDNITATATANSCVDPNGFQVDDQIQYDFSVSNIQEPIEIVANFPGGSETFSVSNSTFSGSLNFAVIDEPLESDGITWVAGTISITSQNGCEDTYPIEVPVVPNPLEISPSQNQTVCVNGNSATLAIQVLSAPAGTPTFSWSGDAVPAGSTSSTINLTGLQDGQTYNVEATVTSADGICTRTVNFTVNVNLDLPDLTTQIVTSPNNTDCNGNTGFCRGDQVEIAYEAVNPTQDFVVRLQIPGYTDGNGDPYDVEEVHQASDRAGSFIVTVEDADVEGTISIRYQGQVECAQEYEVNVPVVPLAVVANAESNQVCSGELVREIGVVPTCEDYTVNWSNSPNQDLITSGLSGNNITVDFTGRTSGFYTFEAEVTGNNCSRIISQTIEFSNNLPDQISGPSGLTGFCVGDLPQNNILLTASKSTGNFDVSQVSLDWSVTPTASQQLIRSGTSLNGSSIVLDVPAGTPTGNYEFRVLVRDRDPENTCEREMTYTLQIVDNQAIQLTTASPEVCDFSEASITASGGLSGEYVWRRLDPETRQVVETYQETSATLAIVTNEAQTMLFTVEDAAAPACIAGSELTLTVASCALDIPNAFTPGPEDDINATFEVPRIQNRDWDFVVYNRYGDVVYQNDNYDNSWDGKDLPEGIYYYLLTSPEKTQEYKGWVRILRNKIGGDSR